MSGPGAQTPEPTSSNLSRTVRVVLAGVLLVVVGVVAWSGDLRTCSSEQTQAESVETVETCEPAALPDPRYVVLLLASALLLAPDIAELSIGSFSLRRRIKENEEKQERLTETVGALQQQVAIQAHQTTFVSVEPTYVSSNAPTVQAEITGIPERAAAEPPAELTPEEMKVGLLEVAERLGIFDTRRTAVPDSSTFVFPSGADALDLQNADQWIAEVARRWPDAEGLLASMASEQARVFTRNFPDALDSIRAVRNAVAHAKYVEPDDLVKTYSTALALEFFLHDQFRRFQELDDGSVDGPRI